jgi:hypothetical protein
MTEPILNVSRPPRSTFGQLGFAVLTGGVVAVSLGLGGCYAGTTRSQATVTYSSAPQQQYTVVQAPTAPVYTSSQPAQTTTYVTQDGTVYAEPAPTYTVYTAPPPPRQVTVQQRPPQSGAVWVNGHWEWNGSQHIWVDGYWVQPQQGYTYVQPRWEQRGGAYVYVRGYQRPSRVVVRQPRQRTVVVQPQPQQRQRTVVVQPQPQQRQRTVVVQPQQRQRQAQPQPRQRTVVVQPQPRQREVTRSRTVQTPAGRTRTTTRTTTTPAPRQRQQPAQSSPPSRSRRVYTPM